MNVCRRNFMVLTSKKPWVFEISFKTHNDALLLCKRLCRLLGEFSFFDRFRGEFVIVTPELSMVENEKLNSFLGEENER